MRPVRRPARTRRLAVAVVAVLAALAAGALDPLTSVAQPASVSAGAQATPSAAAAPVPGTYTAVTPYRALDTRNRTGVPGTTPVGALGTVTVAVGRAGGVPTTGVSAVMATLTVVGGSAPGYLTSWASGTTRPVVSTLNWADGRPLANSAVVPVGADGRIALYNGSSRPVHVVVDVEGWYATGPVTTPGGLTPITPRRVLDTRSGLGTTNTAPTAAGGDSRTFRVAGSEFSSTGADAAVLNVTAVGGVARGYLGPDLRSLPYGASLLMWQPRETRANLILVPIAADGTVTLSVYSTGTTHVVADLVATTSLGALSDAGVLSVELPERVLDTRQAPYNPAGRPVPAGGTVDVHASAGRLAAGPGEISAVAVAVTVTNAKAAGYLTGYSAGASRPASSFLNWAAGQSVTVSVVLPVDDRGIVTLFNGSPGTADIFVDLMGSVLARPVFADSGWRAAPVDAAPAMARSASVLGWSCARSACALVWSTELADGSTTVEVRRRQDGRWGRPLTFRDVPAGQSLDAAACNDSGLCVIQVVTGKRPGTLWTSTATTDWDESPLPVNDPTTEAFVSGVTCPRAGRTCWAWGRAGDPAGEAYEKDGPWVATTDGSGWRAPAFDRSEHSPDQRFLSLSCRTDDDCVGVGAEETTWTVTPWLAHGNRSTFTSRLVTGPGVTEGYARRVTATGTGYLVTGTTSYRSPSLPRGFSGSSTDGVSWSLTSTDRVNGQPSCDDKEPSQCWAVATTSPSGATALSQFPGSTPVVIDSASYAGPGRVSSISCATACAAVAPSASTAIGVRPVVVTQEGGPWRSSLLPLPTGGLRTSEAVGGGARVSCGSAEGCLVVSPYRSGSGTWGLMFALRRG